MIVDDSTAMSAFALSLHRRRRMMPTSAAKRTVSWPRCTLRTLLLVGCAWISLQPVHAAQPAAVAASDVFGAQAAREILDAGGNAVDAAVAIGFTLAVTYPEAGNLGGGGFATVLMGGQEYFLDYREQAPGAATRDMYLDQAGNIIPDASTIGAKAVAVPGTVAGLWALHQRFGHLPWARDLEPRSATRTTDFG